MCLIFASVNERQLENHSDLLVIDWNKTSHNFDITKATLIKKEPKYYEGLLITILLSIMQ